MFFDVTRLRAIPRAFRMLVGLGVDHGEPSHTKPLTDHPTKVTHTQEKGAQLPKSGKLEPHLNLVPATLKGSQRLSVPGSSSAFTTPQACLGLILDCNMMTSIVQQT